ncbi:MAG: DUF502 domain-containing protein [Tepidisphaeraceae bacterium]|jgi:uncharacterized membrane protein
MRGIATILPTLITIWLLLWLWNFLWDSIGKNVIEFICWAWFAIGNRYPAWFQTWHAIRFYYLSEDDFTTRLLGVLLSIILVYFLGVFVGNLLGRTAWRVAERALLRIPLVRAIYPAVKQVTDFILAERTQQFAGSRVVAVQPHEQNIWSVGLVTSSGEWTLDKGPEEMVTVFIPSTPTSFSGYVLVVPRRKVVELPMSVEEAMRLLVTGGVIMPTPKILGESPSPAPPKIQSPTVDSMEQPENALEKAG